MGNALRRPRSASEGARWGRECGETRGGVQAAAAFQPFPEPTFGRDFLPLRSSRPVFNSHRLTGLSLLLSNGSRIATASLPGTTRSRVSRRRAELNTNPPPASAPSRGNGEEEEEEKATATAAAAAAAAAAATPGHRRSPPGGRTPAGPAPPRRPPPHTRGSLPPRTAPRRGRGRGRGSRAGLGPIRARPPPAGSQAVPARGRGGRAATVGPRCLRRWRLVAYLLLRRFPCPLHRGDTPAPRSKSETNE